MRRRFGPYILHRVLGRGGMGEVFIASRRDDPDEAPIVLKRIRPEVIHDPEYAKRLQFEAQVASRVTHPNLIRIIEYGQVGDCPYLALEYLRGYNLARVLEYLLQISEPPPVAVAVAIALGLLDALTSMHAHVDEDGTHRPILHRDVTPQNVIVTNEGRPVLIDLGIAKDMFGPAITMYGRVVGTARYMAPEHRQAMRTDARTDVFSVGMLLFELLVVRAPWPGLSPGKELLRVVFDPPPLDEAEAARIPADVLAAVLGAITCTPDGRWADASVMAAELRATEVGQALGDSTEAVIAEWLAGVDLAPDEDLEAPVIEHRPATSAPPQNEGLAWTATGRLASPSEPPPRISQIPEDAQVTIPPLPPRSAPAMSTLELDRMVNATRRPVWPAVGLAALLLLGAYGGYRLSSSSKPPPASSAIVPK